MHCNHHNYHWNKMQVGEKGAHQEPLHNSLQKEATINGQVYMWQCSHDTYVLQQILFDRSLHTWQNNYRHIIEGTYLQCRETLCEDAEACSRRGSTAAWSGGKMEGYFRLYPELCT